MATVRIARAGVNYFREVRTEVYAKRAWGDGWAYLPFLECVDAEELSGESGVGKATLRWHFGPQRLAEVGGFSSFPPFYLEGAYIRVDVVTGWSRATVFMGVCEHEQVGPWGMTSVAAGDQTFTVFDLKHLLDRYEMRGAVTLDGWIKTPLTFNSVLGARGQLVGNMGGVGGFGANVFDNGEGSIWTAWDVLNYFFGNYVNRFSDVQFVGAGDAQLALVNERRVWNFDGATPLEVLNELVNGRKGLGWKLMTDGVGPIYIYIYSMVSEAIVGGGMYLPANDYQVVMSFGGYRDVEPEITFNGLTRYDEVVVEGGPIYVTGTWAYADGTLEAGFTNEEADDYAEALGEEETDPLKQDNARRADKWDHVFQRHVVPAAWDWYLGDGEGGTKNNAAPWCDVDGTVYPGALANVLLGNRRFERYLPFEAGGNVGGQVKEYRKSFAVVGYADPNAENPDPEGDPDWEAPTLWSFVEEIVPLKFGADLHALESGLGIMVRPRLNHEMAKNLWDVDEEGNPLTPAPAPSSVSAKVDYRTLKYTGRVRTDERLNVVMGILGAEPTNTSRTKLIRMPESIVEYVLPGTITDVVDGALVREVSGAVRDDTMFLLQVAALAAGWYSQVRGTVGWTQGRVSLAGEVGMLVAAVSGPEGVTWVGTPVTRRSWNFVRGEQETRVSTGCEELAYGELGDRG